MHKFIFAILILIPIQASAEVRCTLDTSNPAITHSVIPIQGGSFQGVSQYNDPSEWPFLPFQSHWACPTCTGMPFDASLGFLNPATVHIHLGICAPIYGVIKDKIVVPVQMQAFMLNGKFYFDSGPMAQNAVWDINPALLPWNQFDGNFTGVVIINGHFTFNPFAGDGGPNIHSASPNGWTDFMVEAKEVLSNGDINGIEWVAPIFTELDPSAIEDDIGFAPMTRSGSGITSVRDGGSAPWGSQISQVQIDKLPLLGPFNTRWDLPHINEYMYGGSIPVGGIGTCSMREDMDLHNGIIGNELPGMPADCNGPGYLDPVAIGPGKHKIAFIWQATTGPDGIPGVAIANETSTALLVFNVEVGDVTGPPPITCTDPVVTSSNTVTSDWSSGISQTRTIITTTIQMRTCQ
jgi:hypothetical protein